MRALRHVSLSFATLSLLALPACGGTDQQPDMPNPSVIDRSADDIGLPEASEGGEETAEEDSEPPPPPIQVVAGERTPIEGDAPSVRILAPRNGTTIRRGNVSLRLRVTGWELAPAPGQHVHVIVDDEPYIAIRDVSEPLDLNALVQEHLGHELSEGTHVVRVFPSRGHHESVKEDGAFAMVTFHYRSQTDGFELDADAPMLTYSRPKGCYPTGERILLDFYVSHAELSAEGHRVHYSLDRAIEGDITSWVPHYLENLPVLEHTLQLQLLDAEGNLVPGPFNDTTHTFQVAESCE